MKILITGATGFIGSRLVERLHSSNHTVVAAVRRAAVLPDGVYSVQVGDIDDQTDWSSALTGIDVVFHLAGRAHVMRDTAQDPLAAFCKVNTFGTLNLAHQAAAAGVQRFVFLSSIGVNGNHTQEHPFTAEDIPHPTEPYALSKWEAEQGLQQIAKGDVIDLVIIRPPLVYGLNAPGNFGRLIHWCEKGLPLPLGSVHNKRSLVALDNLVDLLIICVDHPAAANQTFLVSDGEDLSTTELLRRLGQAMGKPARLLPVPMSMLQWGAALIGQKDVAQKLLGSLQVDISATCNTLGWHPPISVDEGLRRCFPEQNEN